MKRINTIGLCLVAVLAFTALAAASASAEGGPEGAVPGFGKCVKVAKNAEKKYTGAYGEKECKTKATPAETGKYELELVNSGTFTDKSKTTTLTTTTTKGVAVTVVCKKDKSLGELIYENEVVKDTITFEKCAGPGGKTDKCGNVGPETIETATLEGLPVWLNEARTEAGVLLIGETGFAKFKCGSEEVEIKGFVEGSATLGGKKGPTITFALNGSKEQALKSFYLGGPAGPFNLYTEPKPGEEVETTLQSVEAMTGPGALY